MKTGQSPIKQITKQRGRKKYKMEGPKSWQTKNPPKRVDGSQEELEQIKYLNMHFGISHPWLIQFKQRLEISSLLKKETNEIFSTFYL